MKQVFQMKAMLLSALLCAMGFISKAQTADGFNYTSCDVIVRFYAVDPGTCTTLAVDPATYVIPVGAAPIFITPAWVPGPPAVAFFVVTEVADAACGFPGVLVGGPCGYPPTAPIPFCPGCVCPGCPPNLVDGGSPIFPPGGAPGMHWPVSAHP